MRTSKGSAMVLWKSRDLCTSLSEEVDTGSVFRTERRVGAVNSQGQTLESNSTRLLVEMFKHLCLLCKFPRVAEYYQYHE